MSTHAGTDIVLDASVMLSSYTENVVEYAMFFWYHLGGARYCFKFPINETEVLKNDCQRG